jgi:hypothetical protein
MFLQNVLRRLLVEGMMGTMNNYKSNRSIVGNLAASCLECTCFEIRPSDRQDLIN